jgi:hypothetical protein
MRLNSDFIHGMREEAEKQLRISSRCTDNAEAIYRAVKMENREKKKIIFAFWTETMKCTFGTVGHIKCDCRSPLWKTPHKHNYANIVARPQFPSCKPPQ